MFYRQIWPKKMWAWYFNIKIHITWFVRFLKIYFFAVFSHVQREEQEHFTSLERQLCVIYVKMKIYAFQNPIIERTTLQCPLRPMFTLVYICNLCSFRFTICFISTCNYNILLSNIIVSFNYIINFKSNKIT